MHSPEVRRFVRLLYTQNPFYLLSAALMLYGMQAAFEAAESLPEPIKAWGLAGALFSYTAVLALTACLIVRLGGVWQDARSIVLILLLLFVAISTSFDHVCNSFPNTATHLLLVGFLLTTLISEAALRGLGICFPWLYRFPYYLLLGLFFLYPLWASSAISGATPAVVTWRVFLFPTACSVAILTLIPAIRKTSNYVKDNGTPWHWPWFPWTAFVFLAIGVCGRAFALTLSFIPIDGWKTPFGVYFLMPVAASILVLLLEIAFAERQPKLARATLFVAPGFVLMSNSPAGTESYEQFVSLLTSTIGSPLWLGVLTLATFYGYAWWRGERGAEGGLLGTLLAASVVPPQMRVLSDIGSPQWWPLLILGTWQFLMALSRRSSLRWLTALLCLTAGASLGLEHTWFTSFQGVIPYHVVLATTVCVGCWFDDTFARMLRPVAALWLTVSGGYAVFALPNQVPFWLACLYIIVLALVAGGLFYRFREPMWLLSALGNVLNASIAHAALSWVVVHRQLGPKAAIALAVGILSFVVAATISAVKGGIRPVLRRHLQFMLKAPAD